MFERGFKSWCENVSLGIRKELRLPTAAPLDKFAFAAYLGVRILPATEIDGLSEETLRVLLTTEKNSWSAVTVSFAGRDWVIYNPTHSEGRQSSDIMHELAHIFIGHSPATVVLSTDGRLATRSFSRQQEDEANWLAGCLLLPRPALLAIANSKRPIPLVCQEYSVSDDLLEYRLNITGARIQAHRKRQARAKG